MPCQPWWADGGRVAFSLAVVSAAVTVVNAVAAVVVVVAMVGWMW